MSKKYVYLFHEGDKDQKDLLGGKGANLAEMTNLRLPVPPGFTITTEVCSWFYANGKSYPEGLERDVEASIARTGKLTGRVFGMQQIVVNPPAAAARVPVWMSSLYSCPGSRRCVCRSMSPGTTHLPRTSTTRPPASPRPSSAIRPPEIRTSSA